MSHLPDITKTVIGVMSGTSLDGLDLALCRFTRSGGSWSYTLLDAKTVAYSDTWHKRLEDAPEISAYDYFTLHAEYGRFIGEEVQRFDAQKAASAVASHGHTVFHQPAKGFSVQVGCGATIAAVTGLTTVYDFRTLDVALGGQGAPLVPMGDKLLFGKYAACLNIGGIANISYDNAAGQRVAYDVCVANMALNMLARREDMAFDRDGLLARSGSVDQALLAKLSGLDYYEQKGAKSIGREWFSEFVEYLLVGGHATRDLLATFTEHAAQVIADELNSHNLGNVLVTGGGAYNAFLLERIRSYTKCELVVPKKKVVEFKEAVIFAFLGCLRLAGELNTLCSVTGARFDSSGGAVFAMPETAR